MKNKRRGSRKRTGKHFNQSSLVRNKDYKCIGDNNNLSHGLILTERKPPSFISPPKPSGKKASQNSQIDIKTIELDVANETSSSWLNLPEIGKTYKN